MAEAQAFDTWNYSIPSSIRDKVIEKLGITTFTVPDAVRRGRTNYRELVKEAKKNDVRLIKAYNKKVSLLHDQVLLVNFKKCFRR